MISKRFLICGKARAKAMPYLLKPIAYYKFSDKLFEFSYRGEFNGKAPAIVLEIAINPEATATLQDWEIESNVQGSLHYAKTLCSNIVSSRKNVTRLKREIMHWIKGDVSDGDNDNA